MCPHRANKFISTWHSLAWMLKWQMELEGGFIFSVAATFLMLETSQKPKQFWYFAHIIYFCSTNREGQEDHLDVSGASAIKRTKGIEMAQKSRSFAVRFLIFVVTVFENHPKCLIWNCQIDDFLDFLVNFCPFKM